MAEARARAGKSSWSRQPIAPEANGEPNVDDTDVTQRTRMLVEDVGSAIRGGISRGADRVGSAVKSGAGHVEKALDDPTRALAAELARDADLPELDAADPIASLAIRLDREADLWRGLAMRELARAAWMDRLAITSTLLALAGALILAAIAGFRALFAPDAAPRVALLLVVAALLPVTGALVVVRAGARIRQGQREIARDALLRADLAESRVHRLAALMSLRASDPEGYAAALRALESDVRAA